MFINKLNQLYKPGRILYYTDADESAIADFRSGKISDLVTRYAGSFGAYDYPGIFYIKSLDKAVIGIEFRENDENITYPDDLQSVVLEGAFFYSIEIDNDFGTGYSSFSLLTRMPLDTLKIDKSFVDKVGVDNEMKEDFFVIRHIISLAKELGFICLAEGAESKSQIDELRALGCDVIQGYYYSKPIPIEEYENKYLN